MKRTALLTLIISLFMSSVAFAEGPTTTALQSSMDMMWIMVAALLVFFMHAGFAMVESGFTRSKNALNILMKNMLTISIASVLYFLVGYGIMFGSSAGGFIGTSGFALNGHEADVGFFLFQAVFSATCATIISGAVAERIKLSSYLLITILMTGFIYPVVGHWIWNGGWLAELGFVDFAGSTVVHLTGALGAVVAVFFLGARIGKYSEGKVNVIPGHNIPLGALGVFILWFGWFGFNGGSTLAADPELIPHVVTTTLLSASCGVLASAFYTNLRYKRIDASLTLNGALAGLVGITAGTANVSLVGAIIIGLVSGIILVEAVQFIDRKLKLDDPVGAIAVHGVAGIWGTLAVGFFDTQAGLVYGGGVQLLGIQALGITAVIVWTVATLGVALFIMTRLGSIRVSREEEIGGLDFAEHGSTAYELREGILSDQHNPVSPEFGSGLIERLNQAGSASSKATG
ncbi:MULTISPECIES: ammonium transporter [Bacillaceae]|uniref:ammonium transporter n=1 Tax=Bacillaceae TaxID=186817 RepID=UPI001BDE5714|nr:MULTISPECIES: ammonium transporter [Bacillaceae]MDX8361344.1 ammonium transporter [Cytobacillus sp. IB215316]MDX8364520.1 ammonium transporter [Cytobacillus sp. IB215665]